jgi:hypothetical protein
VGFVSVFHCRECRCCIFFCSLAYLGAARGVGAGQGAKVVQKHEGGRKGGVGGAANADVAIKCGCEGGSAFLFGWVI